MLSGLARTLLVLAAALICTRILAQQIQISVGEGFEAPAAAPFAPALAPSASASSAASAPGLGDEPPADDYPSSTVRAGQQLQLRVHAYRNFQPHIYPDGSFGDGAGSFGDSSSSSSATASAGEASDVTASSGVNLPSTSLLITVDLGSTNLNCSVFNCLELWALLPGNGTVMEQAWHDSSLDQQGNARNGPYWPVGARINVTLHAADSQGDFFLQSSDQTIKASY
ncbi:hypothetical protein WJX74_008217 [Apatococcus lobatus]|uniref:Uncharacterized protein n=1 Tax=Apatococcus lobatus TaxID=904363 RepID=A0AAW1RPX0_9CHLO